MAKSGQSEPLLHSPNGTIVTEMSEEQSSLPPLNSASRRTVWYFRIYIALQVSGIIFNFACINYPTWFRYCWFNFGVQSAANFAVSESTFNQNIDYLRYLLCDDDLKLTAEQYCPGFCHNMNNLVHAGGVMLFFMLYCVMLSSISTVQHIIKHFKRRYRTDFMRILVVSPSISLLLGAIIYLSVANFGTYRSTNSTDLCPNDYTVDFTLDTGALLWLFNFLLQVTTSTFGFLLTAREFQKN